MRPFHLDARVRGAGAGAVHVSSLMAVTRDKLLCVLLIGPLKQLTINS